MQSDWLSIFLGDISKSKAFLNIYELGLEKLQELPIKLMSSKFN